MTELTVAYLATRTDALLTRVDQLLLGQVLVATQAYDSATTDADPGVGEFRFNHATFASITKVWLDNVDTNAADFSAWVDTWDDGTGTIKGTLVFRGVNTASAFRIFNVTGSVVDKTGYREITVTPLVTGGTWTAGETFAPVFIRAGDAGGTGATGASYAATSTTSLAIASSGSKAFTTQAGLAYVVGSRVRAAAVADPTGQFMEGVVTAYSSTTLTFTADYSAGSGTVANWTLSIAGDGGPAALAAAASASAAATSATNAATSATNAATAETNAETAETAAAASASAAAGSATSAATQATNAATSATNAATSATNAAASETNAAASAAEANAASGCYPYAVDMGSTADSDPGAGTLRFNHATFGSITKLFVSETDDFGANIAGAISAWDDSTNPNRAKIHIRDKSDLTAYREFYITGTIVDDGAYADIPVTPISANGTLSGDVSVYVYPAGNAGAAGAGTGDMVGANNLSDVASASTALSNIGGAPINSPTLTGNPTAPTQTAGNNSTRLATTAYVDGAISTIKGGVSAAFDTLAEVETALALAAPLASPALTGNPTAPTPSPGDNDTSIATTAFVTAALAGASAGDNVARHTLCGGM